LRLERLACFAAIALLSACGSKTGLDVPPPEPFDGGMDAGVDAGRPDGGFDGGPMPDECIELPFNDPPRELPVTFVAQILSADVYFLVDVTGSMGEEIDQIRIGLTSTIIPGLAAQIPDVRFSVGRFADFDIARAGYGSDGDEVFRLVQESTANVDVVLGAVNRLSTQSGGDTPESMTEALYLSATGEGLGRWAPASRCPADTVGYPCWRETGSPIILAFTDAPTHNGPGGSERYDTTLDDWRGGIRPHTYEETINALRDRGAKVLGLNSGEFGETGRPDLEAFARDTGAVRPDGTPIVFDIGNDGRLLNDSVVEAVRTLVDEVPLDVDVLVEDYALDEFDATDFVQRVRTNGANPADGAIDRGDRFEEVRPGTRVNFRVILFNDFLPQTDVAQEFFLWVVLRGDRVTRLRETLLRVVVPPRGGEVICPR